MREDGPEGDFELDAVCSQAAILDLGVGIIPLRSRSVQCLWGFGHVLSWHSSCRRKESESKMQSLEPIYITFTAARILFGVRGYTHCRALAVGVSVTP